MVHEIDRTFRKRKIEQQQLRRRKVLRQRLLLLPLAIIGLGGVLAAGIWLDKQSDTEIIEPSYQEEAGEKLTQIEEEFAVPVYIPAIIDLPGNPIRIELGAGQQGNDLVQIPVPVQLAALGVSGNVTILSTRLVETGQRLSLTVPSSQQDFAFFQSQRNAAEPADAADSAVEMEPESVAGAPSVEDQLSTDASDDDGWGNIGEAGLTGAETEFEQTEIRNNVSTITLTPELARLRITEDVFVQVVNQVDIDAFMTENGINLLDAKRVSASFKETFSMETFDPGSLIAMRQLRTGGKLADRKLVQIAVYLDRRFLGSLAAVGPDRFGESADPWADVDLFRHAQDQDQPLSTEQPQVRLLDGIFAAATRNGVPSGVVGEAIMYLSRKEDLSDVVGLEDRLTLIFASQGREGGETRGRVLYAAISSAGKQTRCFVYQPKGTPDFNCYDEHDESNTIEISNGMVTPVSGGVKTSGFGPRNHPILKKVLLHKGVDWAAPTGTPVLAAFDGTVAFTGNGGGYGNIIKLNHSGGRETRYAHLNAFAPELKIGNPVKAGEVIGFVGTTGRSTGPHLHFELYQSGVPIDPLGQAVAAIASSGGDAVDKLVNRIIHIESGGNANAKNPLSTASGLGQFIESTWLRMMRTYRPDIASLPREQQLALRFDPTLSREMVTNLAKENKAYLVSAGHQVSAGRLYLAHFLGPEGARIVLSNPDDGDLAAILGDGVIRANPFLTGKDVAYIKAWAERKMGGRAPVGRTPVSVATRTVKQASPEFNRFRDALLDLAGKS